MGKRAILVGIVGAAVLTLNGCMMWMHGDMSGGHDGHRSEQGSALIKEVQQGNTKMTAEIPPLWTGRAASLTVKVEDLSSGRPVSGAEIDVLVKRTGEGGMMKSIQGSAREGAANGAYVFQHTFAEEGLYEFVFTVKNAQGPGGASLSLVVQKEVLQAPGSDTAGHGGGKSTTLYIIGGTAMVVMMLAFML